MRVNTETGSIKAFVIIAAVLIVSTGGLIYMASSRNPDKGSDVAITAPVTDKKTEGAAKDDSSKTKPESSESEPGNKEESSDSQPATDQSTVDAGDSANEADSGAATVDEYSQTGPAETLATTVALGVLTFSTASYLISRRSTSSL